MASRTGGHWTVSLLHRCWRSAMVWSAGWSYHYIESAGVSPWPAGRQHLPLLAENSGDSGTVLVSAFRHNLRNVWVVEHWICAPVISILQQLLDPHHSVYAVVHFHLSCISHRPVFIWSGVRRSMIWVGGGDFRSSFLLVASATLSKKSSPRTCRRKSVASSRCVGPPVRVNGATFGVAMRINSWT